MLKSYRLHEEQLANIAQALKQMYHLMHINSIANSGTSGTREIERVQSLDSFQISDAQGLKVGTNQKKNRSAEKWGSRKSVPDPVHFERETSVKCSQCGETFPYIDFLYTEKSGLCIICWEKILKVV